MTTFRRAQSSTKTRCTSFSENLGFYTNTPILHQSVLKSVQRQKNRIFFSFTPPLRRYSFSGASVFSHSFYSPRRKLYGITGTDDQIVTVALSQIGTMGGDPYWSWYGFNSRVEWCACFVSWCANECGYIDAGVIPKYAGCVNGVQWFKDRGQWLDNSAEPTPGMIIFFDWADESGQDGLSDHTGIVQKVENGRVYTVEGNSGDSVRQNSYPVGYYEILGYGAPAY